MEQQTGTTYGDMCAAKFQRVENLSGLNATVGRREHCNHSRDQSRECRVYCST